MPSPIHLVVLVHGLWGNPSHVQSLADEIAAVHPRPLADGDKKEGGGGHAGGAHDESEGGEGAEVVVLNTEGNAADRTYDGVDFCAGRVVEEIEREVTLLESSGKKKVVFFSMAGYSLGGLVARCALGILHSQSPSFFSSRKPLNFATFASPWIGMPRYSSFFSQIAAGIGSRMLSKTGEQLYNVDPLLARMAKKDDVFYQALELFEKVDVYANAVRDRTVPFVTGAFSETDPFSAYETNGINIETDPSGLPLITTYSLPSPATPPHPPTPPTLANRLRLTSTPPLHPPSPYADPTRPYLPPFLRFRFPYNILFFLSLPLAIPIMVCLILYRFASEGRRSRKRVGGVEGETVRERLRVLEREVEREVESGLKRVEELGEDGLDGLVVGGGGKGKGAEKGEGGLRLSEGQKGMIRSLDELKALKKHLVFFPEAYNSHAVIIARDPKGFPEHNKGKQILAHWVHGMVLA